MRKVVLVLGMTIVVWGVPASALPVITNGLVGAWEFDGNANDLSGNGNHGSAVGVVATADRFGNENGAYSFAASQARIEVSPVFSTHQTQLTYVAWIKLPAEGGSLYGEYTTGGATRNYWLARTGWDVNGALTLATYPPSGAGDGNVSMNLSDRTQEWIQVALVRDGNTLSGYLNGNFEGTDTAIGAYTGSTPTLAAIGNRYNSVAGGWYGTQEGSYKFDGSIDDLYIYDRALSPTEVSTLYSPVPEPSTVLLLGLGLVGIAARRRV